MRLAFLNGRELRVRIAISTALVVALGMSVLIGLVLLVVDHSAHREIASALVARRTSVAENVRVDAAGGVSIADPDDARFGGLARVFDRTGTRVFGPRVPGQLQQVTSALVRAPRDRTIDAPPWALSSAPVLSNGRRAGTVVVAVDTTPYTSVLQKTALAAMVIGVAAVVGMTALAWEIVGRALAPVARMSATAESWSEDRLGRRFQLGPPRDELTGLGAVLDSLLDRVSRAIEAEQRLTAELAHELRTPLTVIRGEAGLGRRGSDDPAAAAARFSRIGTAADGMAAAMTTLLDSARGATAVGARSNVRAVLHDLLARRVPAVVTARIDLAEGDVEVAMPSDLLERILAPVLDNANRYAAKAITVSGVRDDGVLRLEICNDGPPLGVDDEAAFTPGMRGQDSPGTGLGLALSRRMARTVGGDLRIGCHDTVSFEVTLPLAGPRPHPTAVSREAPDAEASPTSPETGRGSIRAQGS